jgi:hypothetical protein
MRRLEFTCDGCNFARQVDLPSSGKRDLMPEGWVAHHLVAHENGLQAYEILADLCPECSNKFRHAVNPANWPKLDATVRQFAKR